MAFTNIQIAHILREMADLFEIHYENAYKIRAYRRAARTIENFDTPLSHLVETGVSLETIRNIGPRLSEQILVIMRTGKMPDFVTRPSVATLKSELTGRSPKKRALKFKQAELVLNYLQHQLELLSFVKHVLIAGDFRRKAELVRDVTFLVTATKNDQVIEDFCKIDALKNILAQQKDTVTVLTKSGLEITLIVIAATKLGWASINHTGSASHVSRLLSKAKDLNLEISTMRTASEKAIYERLQLAFIEPELREDRGEMELAQENSLPSLITLNDLKGDLHSHTNETDGTQTLEIMIEGARRLGHQYLAITDHSKRLAITNGLDEKRLLKQIKLIDKLNGRLSNFTILKSIEVDILEDGSLDLSNDVLKELDLCVCSIHSKFRLPEQQQTERIIRAMDNPYFNILGHATGRLITSRPPYPLQMEKIFQAAKERNCFIELNSQPSRLDINDEYCLMAKRMGVKIALSSDAHSTTELDFLRFGINQARRGWLEKEDVINTRSLKELRFLLKRS